MRRYLGKTALACIAALVTVAVYASETSKMVGYRIKPKSESECVTGEWMANFTTVRNYAEKNGLPLFAMWTNGEKCSHCVKFEGVANSKAFREWMAESGIIAAAPPDRCRLSRIDLRLTLPPASRLDCFIEYDSGGTWQHLHTVHGTSAPQVEIPLRPRPCHHLRLRLVGQGTAEIVSISRTVLG